MISRSHFRAVVWFGLGVYAWSGWIQLTMLCGKIPVFSALAFSVSLLGIVAAIYAIRHENQWFADDGTDWRTDK